MDKNNFLMYKDFKSTLDLLTDEQAGKLIKSVFNYVDNRIEPNFKDGMLVVAFNILKTQLERDFKAYKKRVLASQENGKKGGRPTKPIKPSGLIDNLDKPRKGDRDSVRERDSVSVIEKKDKKPVVYFENEKLNKLFNDFLKLRKQLKAKNTDRAITLLTNELNKYDDNIKIQMIEKSIMNSWKSVFPLSGKDVVKQETKIDRYADDEVVYGNGE